MSTAAGTDSAAGTDRTAALRADVVVIGDGPAGSALAAACAQRDLDVLLVGPDERWSATYGTWIDDLADVAVLGEADVFGARLERITAYGACRHELGRPYGVIDNTALKTVLRSGVERIVGSVASTRVGVTHHSVELTDGRAIRSRLVVNATGRPGDPRGQTHRITGRGVAWQTALGVVLAEPPDGPLGEPTLMDFRPLDLDVASRPLVPTFGYALPVADGWLVEETVLATRPAVDPQPLRARLAARLGRPPDDPFADAVRTELVRIPMGGPVPDRAGAIVDFGAAAGFTHPATGFSVGASLRAAPRVADAIAAALEGPDDLAADARTVSDAIWPPAALRTRVLHDYGLELLLGLDGDTVREFFDRFFELPTERWAGYLRIDEPPAAVSRTMIGLFRSSSWSMRRRLASGNPLSLVGLLRR